ncbi:MAG TPA: cupin domain-containing protein [Candidatus Angelobacter sp.]|nr:cupin domain-containing protein [Candidatus Angelobacter sp.]
MRLRIAFCLIALLACLAPILSAQDAVKVDPKHYTVVTDNDQVRVLKVHYGPHEKSVMHSHPATVAVFLSDAKGQFTFPDGKKQDYTSKTGESQYTPAQTHLPENTGDTPLDLIVVELKGKPAKAPARKEPAKK